MRRFALVLLTAAAIAVPSLALATPASADPLEPLRVINVFVTGDGDVCVTYNNLTTACTYT